MTNRFSVVAQLNALLGLMVVAVAGLGAYAIHLQSGRAVGFESRPGFDPTAVWLTFGCVCLVVGLGVALRLSIRQGILRSIRGAAHVIGRVAEGDLTARTGVQAHGETRKMLEGLERMTSELGLIVRMVSSGATTVADASAQISEGNRDLSHRTEEQAAALERTAHALEQLTVTVARNAGNASRAAEVAARTAEAAKGGGEVVQDVVGTMTRISASSRRIQDIIALIDGVAFQTNILALNAAVEAARAGEQGRGFAVVAGEVRNLSQRTAAAARDVKALISESVQEVERGSRLVSTAGETIRNVVEAVVELRPLIAEISDASKEQSNGLAEINAAVGQMERMVQQDAALVEQAAAAATAMTHEANLLLGAVSRFQLEPVTIPYASGPTRSESERRARVFALAGG